MVGACQIPARLCWFHDAPLPDLMQISSRYKDILYHPGFHSARAVLDKISENGIRVVLTGMGGDEVLGSDPDVYMLRYADLATGRQHRELTEDLRIALKYYSLLTVLGFVMKYALMPIVKRGVALGLCHLGERRWSRLGPSFVQERIRQDLLTSENTGASMEAFELMCAYHGLEPRHPFFDSRVIEFLLSIPPEQLSRRYQTKLILRRGMRGILPEVVRRRTTKATASPFVDWEIGQMRRETVERIFDRPRLCDGIDWVRVRKAFRRYCENRGNRGVDVKLIERALAVELWYRTSVRTEEEAYGKDI